MAWLVSSKRSVSHAEPLLFFLWTFTSPLAGRQPFIATKKHNNTRFSFTHSSRRVGKGNTYASTSIAFCPPAHLHYRATPSLLFSWKPQFQAQHLLSFFHFVKLFASYFSIYGGHLFTLSLCHLAFLADSWLVSTRTILLSFLETPACAHRRIYAKSFPDTIRFLVGPLGGILFVNSVSYTSVLLFSLSFLDGLYIVDK